MNTGYDFALKTGQVIEIIYPEEKRKRIKGKNTFYPILYTVMVEDRDDFGRNQNIYFNCMVADNFGGTADYLDYTLRPNPIGQTGGDLLGSPDKVKKEILLGSYVLILCVNGNKMNSIIVSGIKSYQAPLRDGNTYKEAKKEDGHHLKFSFNGVDVGINQLGELDITYNGPNDQTGKLLSKTPAGDSVDSKSVGSFVKINKSGDITVSANTTGDKTSPDNFVQIKKDGTINVFADKVNMGDKNSLDYIALSTKVDNELKSIQAELKKIQATLLSGTAPPLGGPVTFAVVYPASYSPNSVAAKHTKGS